MESPMAAQRKSIDCRDYPSEKNCSLKISGAEEEVLNAAVQHAISVHGHANTPEFARADKIDAQGRARLKEAAADRGPLFRIRALCVSASTSSSASSWRVMSESLPDHATPTTTGGKSDNGSARSCGGGLKPGTATVKPMPYPLAT